MKSYKLVPVSVRPEKEGWYLTFNGDDFFCELKWKDIWYAWDDHELQLTEVNQNSITHYLLPVSEEEHREEMREVWEACKKYHLEDNYPDFDTFYNNKFKPE
jgi:hypothetical protein